MLNKIESIVSAIENLIIAEHPTSDIEIKEIESICNQFFKIINLKDFEEKIIIKKVKARFTVSVGLGTVLKGNYEHQSWFYNEKSKIVFYYWDRYKKYLNENGFSQKVVNTMDDVSDIVVNLLGNPKKNGEYKRRGLVVGEVQSGKTANYISIITKAADAGYKLIFLLTGMQNTLRSQTQERIDLGFLGFDSSRVLDNKTIKVGVGNIDFSKRPLSMTTIESDFNRAFAQKQLVHLISQTEPTIFVVKKNSSVLRNICQWLKSTMSKEDLAKLPMLMIDDEADQASINTKSKDYEPTTINKRIREILNLFPKQNYIGFTATPFANVFIDPNTEDEMYQEDIFPKDFIYSLDAPSNYVSPESIFGKHGRHKYMLCEINDVSPVLKLSHKKDAEIYDLPNSLRDALYLFLLSNSIRDLRGETNSHRSMMVQMSRFTMVQDNIAEAIEDYVREIKLQIKQYPYKKYKDMFFYKELKRVFSNYYTNLRNVDIEDIMLHLNQSIQPIIVTSVNIKHKADEVLNYKTHKEFGLRVIAVGGQILSRGLTLEGLTISYFYRNSKYYDTLMQMGRWFGYRPGYEDLCRIFMYDEAIDWYTYISEATLELKQDIIRMRKSMLTPLDFGLKVMNYPGTLYITAPSKLRTAKDYVRSISMSGEVIETPRLYLSKEITKNNFIALDNLLKKLDIYEEKTYSTSKYPLFVDVDKICIMDFLHEFVPHKSCLHFQTDQLSEYLSSNDLESLKKWDIVIAQGLGKETVEIYKHKIRPVNRQYKIRNNNIIQISGQRNRLGDTSTTKAGLTPEQIELAKREHRIDNNIKNNQKVHYSAKTYTKYISDRKPLLIIYIVELSKNISDNGENTMNGKILLGASLAFPKMSEKDSRSYIKYKINKQAYKEMFFDDDYDEGVE